MVEQYPLDQFVKELINDKKLSVPDKDVQSQLELELKGKLEEAINRALLNSLSEDDMAKIESFGDNLTDSDMQKVIQESGINTTEIITGVLLRFRSVYLEEGV